MVSEQREREARRKAHRLETFALGGCLATAFPFPLLDLLPFEVLSEAERASIAERG